MATLLVGILRFLIEKFSWLVVIMLILLAGSWLRHEWQLVEQAEQEKQQLQSTQQILQKRYHELQITQTQLVKMTDTLRQQLLEKAKQLSQLQLQLQQLQQQRQQLWEEHWWARKNPSSDIFIDLKSYDAKILALTTEVNLAQQAHILWQTKLNQSPEVIKSRQLVQEMQQSKTAMQQLDQSISQQETLLNSSYIQRVRVSLSAVLPTALTILLGLILIPILFKVLMYFVLAPVVTRLPPVVILPDDDGIRPVETPNLNTQSQGHVSTHAVTVTLLPKQELLIHPDYLQSYSRQSEKTTRWFLNAHIPFSCLAAGLVTLVCVRSRDDKTETVQIASTRQVHSEVMILDLPAGATLVCKPHCLVGVIKYQQDDVRITRHWRLNYLHSWLTFQFRYFVFHGACQLIVKGNCGVILEPVGEARLIQQSATLGFSAGAAYANYRCETFVSYYMDKDTLFNDQFSGQSGIYFYEQTPDKRQNQNMITRTFGGVWDAILKVFGI